MCILVSIKRPHVCDTQWDSNSIFRYIDQTNYFSNQYPMRTCTKCREHKKASTNLWGCHRSIIAQNTHLWLNCKMLNWHLNAYKVTLVNWLAVREMKWQTDFKLTLGLPASTMHFQNTWIGIVDRTDVENKLFIRKILQKELYRITLSYFLL